jgi:amino acid transporter
MLLGTLVVGLFYLALNTAFVLAPPFEEIAGREQVALIAAQTLGGQPWAEWIRWTVMLSLFTSVSVMIMTGPRVYAKMAEEGLFPRWFRQDHLTPRAAILLQAVLAIVVILISDLKQLLSYLGYTLSLSAALTVASLFRKTLRSQLSWPILFAAGGFVASTVVIALLAASLTPWESLAALMTLLLGLVVYQFLPSRDLAGGNSQGKSDSE